MGRSCSEVTFEYRLHGTEEDLDAESEPEVESSAHDFEGSLKASDWVEANRELLDLDSMA